MGEKRRGWVRRWPGGRYRAETGAGLHEEGGKDRVVVTAVMAVFVMVSFALARQRSVVIGVTVIMVLVIMDMHAQSHHLVTRMPMQICRRRPGELERDDKHEDQGDKTAHGGHSRWTTRIAGRFIHTEPFRPDRMPTWKCPDGYPVWGRLTGSVRLPP